MYYVRNVKAVKKLLFNILVYYVKNLKTVKKLVFNILVYYLTIFWQKKMKNKESLLYLRYNKFRVIPQREKGFISYVKAMKKAIFELKIYCIAKFCHVFSVQKKVKLEKRALWQMFDWVLNAPLIYFAKLKNSASTIFVLNAMLLN